MEPPSYEEMTHWPKAALEAVIEGMEPEEAANLPPGSVRRLWWIRADNALGTLCHEEEVRGALRRMGRRGKCR